MLENPVLTVAFIVAITTFFKKQLALSGWAVLLASFIVSLFFGLVPILSATFPLFAPWLNAVTSVAVLFLTAAGSVDFIVAVRTTTKPPEQGLASLIKPK